MPTPNLQATSLSAEPRALTAIPSSLRDFLSPLPIALQCEVVINFMGTCHELERRESVYLAKGRAIHPPLDWPWLTVEERFEWAAKFTIYNFSGADNRQAALDDLKATEVNLSLSTSRSASTAFHQRVAEYLPVTGTDGAELGTLTREIAAHHLAAYGAMCALIDMLEAAHALVPRAATVTVTEAE